MAVLRARSRDDGYYIHDAFVPNAGASRRRAAPEYQYVTYQITQRGLARVLGAGVGDGDNIPDDLFRSLKRSGDIFYGATPTVAQRHAPGRRNGLPRVISGVRQASRAAKGSEGECVYCAICDSWMRENRFREHLNTHDRHHAYVLDANFRKCPWCGLELRMDYLESHLQVAHGKRPKHQSGETIPQPTNNTQPRSVAQASKESTVPAGPSRPSATLAVCTVCGQQVREDRLAKHMRRVHDVQNP